MVMINLNEGRRVFTDAIKLKAANNLGYKTWEAALAFAEHNFKFSQKLGIELKQVHSEIIYVHTEIKKTLSNE